MSSIFRLISSCVSITILFGSILLAAQENNSEVTVSNKIERLEYRGYTKRAQERIISLRETISLAESTHGQVEAYALFLYMKIGSQQTPYFYVDREALSEEEKMGVDTLEREMKELNLRAFIALKKACERIVEAKGYGSNFLRVYYEEKLNELKSATPLN